MNGWASYSWIAARFEPMRSARRSAYAASDDDSERILTVLGVPPPTARATNGRTVGSIAGGPAPALYPASDLRVVPIYRAAPRGCSGAAVGKPPRQAVPPRRPALRGPTRPAPAGEHAPAPSRLSLRAAGRGPKRRAGSGIDSEPMQTAAWQGVGNDCEHPFGGRLKARTDALPGSAGQAPAEPA